MELRPFQRDFLRHALSGDADTACLSLPRGNGKSALAGHLVARVMSPADPLFRPGTESVIGAASMEQGRIVYRFARDALESTGEYRFLDSGYRIGITHLPTQTRLRVIGSNGKGAMGLVGCPWAILDEPGSYEATGGALLWDAISTAQGKPGSPLKAILIGTIAPSRAGWWRDLVEAGSRPGYHVTALQGDPEKWDRWPEIRRVNPLTAVSAEFRRKLVQERDEARGDTRLKARFLSYRLNVPTADESEMLLTVDDWQRVLARPSPNAWDVRLWRMTLARAVPGLRLSRSGVRAEWRRSLSAPASRLSRRRNGGTGCQWAPMRGWWMTAFCIPVRGVGCLRCGATIRMRGPRQSR